MTKSINSSALRSRIRRCEFHRGTTQCRLWSPGHLVHYIQARLVGESPWGWRDALVVALDGLEVTVRYLAEDVEFQAWHHNDLSRDLTAGAPVRLHQRFGVMSGPFGLAYVVHNSPLSAVPAPEHPELWASQTTGGVVNLATGYGIDLSPSDGGNE